MMGVDLLVFNIFCFFILSRLLKLKWPYITHIKSVVITEMAALALPISYTFPR